jgi:hypothetical protein
MRRFMIFSLAPISIVGLLAVGCQSSGEDNTATVWNDGNPWGTHKAAQTGEPMSAGTAVTLPPTTQPAQ